MWYDAQDTLDKHELPAVMHLVLLDPEQALEASAWSLAHRISERLGQEFRRQRLEPFRILLAFRLQEIDDLGFGARGFFRRFCSSNDRAEVVTLERRNALVAMHVVVH